jgi:two-component system, chemotaxis family, chemotaxis protein CheY
VLCDWNMPNMNGLEFVEGVAQVPAVAAVPVVMVTTEGTADKIAQAKAANPNMKGYVIKPFTPEQLKEAIAPILGMS